MRARVLSVFVFPVAMSVSMNVVAVAMRWSSVRWNSIDDYYSSTRLEALHQLRDHGLRIINVVQGHAHDCQLEVEEFPAFKRSSSQCKEITSDSAHLGLRHACFAGFGVELVDHAFRDINTSDLSSIRKQCLHIRQLYSPIRSPWLAGKTWPHFRHGSGSAGVVE